jgi:transposase
MPIAESSGRLTWIQRRASVLQLACNHVAEQVQSGGRIGRAIRIAARKFRGRSLGDSRRLRLSAKHLYRLWYESRHGRDPRAFQLCYRAGLKLKDINPVFLRLIVDHAVQRGLSIPAAVREMNLSNALGASIHTLYRRLPTKKIGRLAALTRRAVRLKAAAERGRQEILQTIHADEIDPMKSPRKPRIQGKIANLPAEQREEVHRYIRENLTYSAISERMQKEFGVKIAVSLLSVYRSTHYAEIFHLVNAAAAHAGPEAGE